jgi:hypothetical protein
VEQGKCLVARDVARDGGQPLDGRQPRQHAAAFGFHNHPDIDVAAVGGVQLGRPKAEGKKIGRAGGKGAAVGIL